MPIMKQLSVMGASVCLLCISRHERLWCKGFPMHRLMCGFFCSNLILIGNEDYITIDSHIIYYEIGTKSKSSINGKALENVKNVDYEALFVINVKAPQE